jgi:cathepsin B
VVTGTQQLEDVAATPSDPFFGANLCSAFSLPHCHHHGPAEDPYPAEGDSGCESQTTPRGPTSCDETATSPNDDFKSNKYSFKGTVEFFPNDVATIQNSIMTSGPVETAFTVYADFEDYDGGVYEPQSSQSVGGHAVRIVGWGTDADTGKDYWKVANSWNPYWGEEGYFRILRGKNTCGIESQVVASSADAVWGLMSEL